MPGHETSVDKFVTTGKKRIIQRRGHGAMSEIEAIATDVIACGRCPRLRAHCAEIARVGKKAHRGETYWARPVPGFGDPEAWLLVIGLAPGAHGANRTGRMFTGDRSGEWLDRKSVVLGKRVDLGGRRII